MEFSQHQQETFSLLLPLGREFLLIPRAAVEEVVGFAHPKSIEEAPDWLLGSFPWRDQQLPLIAFEGVYTDEIPSVTNRTRIAVIHALSEHARLGHFGIVSQGFPQLLSVHEKTISLQEDDDIDSEYVFSHVQLANQNAMIPDLISLEEKLWLIL